LEFTDEEKPFFMQIIMPMEKKKWQKMLRHSLSGGHKPMRIAQMPGII
jgi:hypothetical protein